MQWMCNFIPKFIVDVITYQYRESQIAVLNSWAYSTEFSIDFFSTSPQFSSDLKIKIEYQCKYFQAF